MNKHIEKIRADIDELNRRHFTKSKKKPHKPRDIECDGGELFKTVYRNTTKQVGKIRGPSTIDERLNEILKKNS